VGIGLKRFGLSRLGSLEFFEAQMRSGGRKELASNADPENEGVTERY
jgi:hypothetical protein